MVRYRIQDEIFFFWCAYPDESWQNPVTFVVKEDASPEEEAKASGIPFKKIYPANYEAICDWFKNNLNFLMHHTQLPEDPEKKWDFVFCVFCEKWNKVFLPRKFDGSVNCSSCNSEVRIHWM